MSAFLDLCKVFNMKMIFQITNLLTGSTRSTRYTDTDLNTITLNETILKPTPSAEYLVRFWEKLENDNVFVVKLFFENDRNLWVTFDPCH